MAKGDSTETTVDSCPELWLEVTNVRFISNDTGSPELQVQLKGQKLTGREGENWWPVAHSVLDAGAYFKTVTEALDKKRLAFVRLAARKNSFVVDALRLDYVT